MPSHLPHLPEHDVPPATPRWIGWAVIALAVLMVLQGAYAQYRESEQAEERGELLLCLNDWADRFTQVIEIRAARLDQPESKKPPYPEPEKCGEPQ